jgi:FAD/FMN-containing dehydrogenase
MVNDIQSQLNPTRVARIVRPRTIEEIQVAVRDARRDGRAISVCGGRHAQGGQQFGTNTVLLDLSSFFNKVLKLDLSAHLVEVQAGIQWPELIEYLHRAQHGAAQQWSIRQKQTGVDHVSLAGTLSANAHGRGLRFQSIVGDIESFDLVDSEGNLRTCSREENRELFSLVIGGYGLFGIIAHVRLRLVPRQKVERVVKLIEVRDLLPWIEKRVQEGFLYGDCQYSIEPVDDSLTHSGVFSCYRPVPDDTPIPKKQKYLSPREWFEIFYLAHKDKSKAVDHYQKHYIASSGQIYWSDTHQMSGFVNNYHLLLDKYLGATVKGSEVILEVYVSPEELLPFLTKAREEVRQHSINLFYGTIRFLEQDDITFLAVAPKKTVCVLCNVHVDHTDEGIHKASDDYRRLIDCALKHNGRYFLTYTRWPTREQLEAAFPQFPEFLRLKKKYDPQEVFRSNWYDHYKQLFGE